MEPPVVWVIHDDDGVRASLKLLLEAEGWAVYAFKTPAEMLASIAPLCLVLDQHLIGTTSLQFVDELRRRGLEVPVVLTAPIENTALRAQAARAGVATVDPLDPADLVETVKAAITKTGGIE
jgi:FixJ family two-component response regulator